jgi:hypothetical protein
MVPRLLSWFSRSLVALGIVLILSAVLWPLKVQANLYLGVGLLVAAAIVKLVTHYLLRTPWPSRSGRPVEAHLNPILYGFSFISSVAIFALI